MLNGSVALIRVWPKEKNSSNGRPISVAKLPKYLRIISRGKESLPAGTGRVGGENIGGRCDLKGGVKIELLLRDEPPNPLEAEKGGVAFVHVENVRLDPERAQGVDAANTEHDLLSHSHFEVAAVKLGGDEAIFRVVLRDIGVEQVKLDAADLKLPNASVNIAVQNRHRHQQRAIVAPDFPDRQMMKILIETDRVLDPVLVDFLPEISVSIEQADGDKIQVEVAG